MKNASVCHHLAVIMDGNGRWAEKRNLPRTEGHRRGSDSLLRLLGFCENTSIQIVTVYAFSTENWNRPESEVNALMDLFVTCIEERSDELCEKGIGFLVSGRWHDENVPKKLQSKLTNLIEKTKQNEKLKLNICFNYGGRSEIVDSVNSAIKELIQKNNLNNKTGKNQEIIITEDIIQKHLYQPNLPSPDLIIRTAGEYRLSNFLLWEMAYSEIFVTNTLWPDFSKEDFENALDSYNHRERKFGTIIENKNSNVLTNEIIEHINQNID